MRSWVRCADERGEVLWLKHVLITMGPLRDDDWEMWNLTASCNLVATSLSPEIVLKKVPIHNTPLDTRRLRINFHDRTESLRWLAEAHCRFGTMPAIEGSDMDTLRCASCSHHLILVLPQVPLTNSPRSSPGFEANAQLYPKPHAQEL